MTLLSLKENYPNYRETYSDSNIGHLDDYSVYATADDKVGTVEDGLIDPTTGQFRYLVVDTGFWIFGKKVLLPIGRTRFDNAEQRVYVDGLTKEQVENLPEYNGEEVDYNYEERVRGVYRENSLMNTAPVDAQAAYTAETYSYEQDADLYTMEQHADAHQPIRLYEERLIADKQRVKTGDVVVGKRIETETASVSVPVEKQRVVIERSAPTAPAASTSHEFADGEVARVEVYEERADVRKEAVVREEVNVRRESEQDMVSREATIRREELDIDAPTDAEIINR